MSVVKFALIGCGKIADKHARVISNLDGGELCAVSDLQATKAKAIGKSYGIPWYTDYHEMMGKEDIDVVNILTPSGLHVKQTIEVAKYGKHVVVEKPMALSLAHAREMIEICEKYKVKLFVVKQNRYNLPVKKLKETIEKGRFGKMVLASVRVRWCRKQDYYDSESWRGTYALDGGVFANQAAHHVDMLLWLMGEVDSVFAKISTRLVEIEAEDTGAVVLKFKNGALGIIEATTATRPTDLEDSLSILGEKGTVEIGGFAMSEIKIWNFNESFPENKNEFSEFHKNPSGFFAFAHSEYLKGVVDSVKNNKKIVVDGQDGLRFLHLIHAIYESAETGKEVYLSHSQGKSRLGVTV